MNRPTTEEEIKAHYERSVAVFREASIKAGVPLTPEAERAFRVMFYLGGEAFLTEVGKIRFLAPEDKPAQWKRLCDVCAKGVKL